MGEEDKVGYCSCSRFRLAVSVEAVDAVLDLGEDATGGIQLANCNNRRYHLQSVDEAEAVGVRLEKYERLTVSAVLDSSVGGWDAGLAFDLIAVRVRFGDREIAPCPEQKWKPQASANRARLFASEPSYGWTVNMPLTLALARSCRIVYGPGAGTRAPSPIAAPEIYPSAYHTPTRPPDFAPIT